MTRKKTSSRFPRRSLIMMGISLLGVMATTAYFMLTRPHASVQQTVQSVHYCCETCGARSALNNPKNTLTSDSVSTVANFRPVITALHSGQYRDVLETERLLLREVTLDDVDRIFSYKSDDETAQSASWKLHKTKADTKKEITEMIDHYRKGENAHWGIVLKETNTIIGFGGFTMMTPMHNRATAGWWLGAKYWGKGYATEIARAVIEYGFTRLKLNRIDAVARVDNAASGRVLEKAGMYRIGTHRDFWRLKNELSSWHQFAILRKDVTEQISRSILS